MPFTPKANSTAKEVLIALGYVTGGFNKGSISIFIDAGDPASRSKHGRRAIFHLKVNAAN
jgi:hypothetical protein